MFRNYLEIAYRSLVRHKGYTAINLFGLELGTVCCLLIGLYVQDEPSFDRFHEHTESVYRVTYKVRNAESTEHYAWAVPALAPVPLTVGYQAVKAALADPVKSLRCE